MALGLSHQSLAAVLGEPRQRLISDQKCERLSGGTPEQVMIPDMRSLLMGHFKGRRDPPLAVQNSVVCRQH